MFKCADMWVYRVPVRDALVYRQADVLVSRRAVYLHGCPRGRADVQVYGCTSVHMRGCARARVCACVGVRVRPSVLLLVVGVVRGQVLAED